MAQTAAREIQDETVETVKDTANKATETARETTGKAVGAGKEAAGKTVEMTKEAAGRATGAAKEASEQVTGSMREATERTGKTASRMVDNGSRALGTMLDAENNIVKLWMDTTREQLEHNAETLHRLLAVRDWREAAEIQTEYVRESLSRFSHLMSAQLEVSGAVSEKVVAVGREQAKEAGKAAR